GKPQPHGRQSNLYDTYRTGENKQQAEPVQPDQKLESKGQRSAKDSDSVITRNRRCVHLTAPESLCASQDPRKHSGMIAIITGRLQANCASDLKSGATYKKTGLRAARGPFSGSIRLA